MTDLTGRTALVTGSTSGIGKATAIALAVRGAHVLVVGRDGERAREVVAEIEGSGGSASFRVTTLGDLESARELVEWAPEAGDDQQSRTVNMSADVILEFTVKDPDIYREKYARLAGQTAKDDGGGVMAAGNWDLLHGDDPLSSGVLVQFTDRETALGESA
jgi:uncharacterized protein (DUF1330 family)